MSKWNPLAAALLAAGLLTGIAGCATSDGQRTAGQVIDDATLTAKVKTALAKEPGVSALAINVDTDRGVVYLKGRVASATEAARAVETARKVDGVGRVVNELEVRSG